MATALTFDPHATPAPATGVRRLFVPRLSAAQRQALRELTHRPSERLDDGKARGWFETGCFTIVAVGFAALIGMAFGRAFDVPMPATMIAGHVDETVAARSAAKRAVAQTRPRQPSSETVSRTM